MVDSTDSAFIYGFVIGVSFGIWQNSIAAGVFAGFVAILAFAIGFRGD